MILIEFLLRAHGAVGAKPIEHGARRVVRLDRKVLDRTSRLVWVTSSLMPTVKWFFGAAELQFVEDRLDHGRGELFGGEAVAPPTMMAGLGRIAQLSPCFVDAP